MKNIQFGADYYPEHWPEERWETDARLMKEMGLEVVRMAEFAWTRLEPKAGDFRFGWLERAIDLLGAYGIKTILGTPTPTPPAWIIELHPEILPVDSQNRRMAFGGRHHNCQSAPAYRAHAQRMIEAFSSRFGHNENVVAWQIDNEFGNSHEDLCHCGSCRAAFQDWLRDKYGTTAELNRRWGTVFWSQEYDRFEQIPTPAYLATSHNPSLLLDWKRFHSDLICSFQKFQVDILRKNSPRREITHNMMGSFDLIDYFKLSAPLDFVSHDHYPTGYFDEPQPGKTPATLAANLDLMRGLKNRSFCVMEQQSGPTGWAIMGRTPAPGQLGLWTAQSVARGADTVVFFRWRSCLFGTEQYWHGILPHNGKPGRRYEELKQNINRLKPVMKEFKGASAGAQGAILYDYEQNWALEIQPHHPELDYIKHTQLYYDAFYERNVALDFINRERDFTPYKFIIAPLLFIQTPGLIEKLERYVEEGGRLVLTMRTGVKNSDNICISEGDLPGGAAEFLGIQIPDYDCLRDAEMKVSWGDESALKACKWCDLISLKGAAGLAEIAEGWYKGTPVITENPRGKGTAWYVGTEPGRRLMDRFVDHLLSESAVEPFPKAEGNLEILKRTAPEKEFLFVLNHGDRSAAFPAPGGWEPLCHDGQEEIPAYSYSLFTRRR